jgi:3'(2'), 5'-bisphosphate nucleotidase
MDIKTYEEIAVKLVEDAAITVRDLVDGGYQVYRKQDGSQVTSVDYASEKIILEGLRQNFPDIPIISEEEYCEGKSPTTVGNIYWSIDSIDGTSSMIAGRDEFAICVALIKNGTPILGVIGIPMTYETYWGNVEDKTAWKKDTKGVTKIHTRDIPKDKAVIVHSRTTPSEWIGKSWKNPSKVWEYVSVSSALKFCMIADGSADYYYRGSALNEWDVAAGHALVTAAGGSMTHNNGTPIFYGNKGFFVGGFIASGEVRV